MGQQIIALKFLSLKRR